MRKVINKSTAIRAVVLIFALIGILTIFPARLYSSIWQAQGGGELTADTKLVNYEHDTTMQEFVAQYERLSSIDVYIQNVEKGRYIGLMLIDEYGVSALKTYIDTEGLAIPGFVNVPMEVNLEVGKSYAVKMIPVRSKYFIGTEDVRSAESYLGNLTEEYQPVEGRHLAARYNYRIPMSKAKSLIWIVGIAALAVIICTLVKLFYKKNPDRNSILTVESVLRYVANPVAAIVFLALMLMVFPFKVFDSRPADIIFYEIGLIITAAITFYAINHRVVTHNIGVSFWQSLKNEDRLQYVLIMFSIAMGLWYASEYMNGLYDIYHSISEKHMTIWILIAIILTFKISEALNLYNLIWALGSGIYGIYYYNLHKIAETEKEADLQNLVLRCSIIISILGGLLILNFVRLIVLAIKKKKLSARPSVFGVILAVFFVTIIVLRNTRVWGIYLALLFTCLFIRLAVWDKKKDYYKILAGGLMMNFGISLVFSLLHRYFAGYTLGRFAFIFHTVTVTAEYFTFMGAVATVLLVVKIVSLPKGCSLKDMIVIAWKELVLFGFIMSYAIFTVSRTGYLAIIASTFLVLCVVATYYVKHLPRIIGVFALSLILCFPAAFTLQRIIPTMVADPVIYPIDETDEFVKGGADWDSTNFMCVERFANLFEAKILGMDVGSYEFPIDKNNYEKDGTPVFDNYGFPFEDTIEEQYEEGEGSEDYGLIDEADADNLLAASTFTRAEYHMLLEEMVEYIDDDNILDVISNGRITIFKAYIQELNMWGHEDMGAMLPNGEIAVHAHNTFIQVAYDHGMVGGACFIIMMAAALISSLIYVKNNREKEMLSLITCAMIIGFAVAGLTEWVFHYCNPMTVALMLAIAPLTFKAQENE
ncbi:hypothetical protein D6855_08500 [Butyrivibrio sp. CB08]|uniref:O-antigen ligase family protein n=1 Tax=Butyrivibrio sp. CB08 TaxID=2364879 RepID=UPI000EA8FAC2|nr:hypothetical protein [Butyrivibrio sp. CB08]RKM59817.1 hypothetical protein D6855_08500 [Butyrivibrio sp. CB08]